MYEQNAAPGFRRVVWVALWFIVTVVVLWVLVWLLFFRHSSPKVSTLHGSDTKQSQSSNNKSNTNSGTNGNSGSGSTGSNGQNNAGSTAPTTPGATAPPQLANTGAGDVFVPFAVASVTGGVLYYVRLRKKLLS